AQPHLEHRTSTDGRTWSDAAVLPGEGRAPRAAVDSHGTLHVVFGRKLPGIKNDCENRIWHTSREARAGSMFRDPVEIKVPSTYDPQITMVTGARIAIDGRDNVHVIAWKLILSQHASSELGDWKDLQRCIYTRKPAGAGQSFEPVVELLHHGSRGSGFGDIARAPNGNVHIVYNAWDLKQKQSNWHKWRTTHVVRSQDGDWLPETHEWRMLGGDFGFSIAIDRGGVVHVAGFDSEGAPKRNSRWCHFTNADRADEMTPRWDSEDFPNITTDILLGPSGDVWMTRANNKDRLARYVHFDASRKVWSEPQSCSPPERVNLASRWNQMPKLAFFRGTARVVFLEKVKDEDFFRFKQHLLRP
ncbi:MAG: hypothetical protein ACREH8_22505, partial [Opitutaceae bacterium]